MSLSMNSTSAAKMVIFFAKGQLKSQNLQELQDRRICSFSRKDGKDIFICTFQTTEAVGRRRGVKAGQKILAVQLSIS